MSVLKRYGWIMVVIIFVVYIYFQQPRQEEDVVVEEQPQTFQKEETIDTPETFKVDVKGEVEKPGVYEVHFGMRVDDVIKKAGGLTADADPASVNLAQKLQDEMVILVAGTAESIETATEYPIGTDGKIAINQATMEEIQTLNGIGPSKAAAIIQYRDENGPFSSVDDLVEVPGIGEKTLENMKDSIRVP